MDPGLGGERVPLGSSDESSDEELVSPRRDRDAVGGTSSAAYKTRAALRAAKRGHLFTCLALQQFFVLVEKYVLFNNQE